jgi:glycosyltransferase involved in cell wall biosynthesis
MARDSISVVIPVFNGERFLGEAIASVLAQTRAASEVIVVDDGSTDGSAAVAEDFAEVRVIRTENRGPAAARNTGVEEASGELITFLDSDDVMKPDRLERQLAALAGDPSASFCLGRGEMVMEPGVTPPGWFNVEQGAYMQMSLFTTREAFDRVGPFEEVLRVGEDTDWLFRAFEAGLRPVFVDEPVIVRRYHGGNLSYDVAVKRAAQLRVLRRRVDRNRTRGAKPSAVSAAALQGLPKTLPGVPGVSSHDDDR